MGRNPIALRRISTTLWYGQQLAAVAHEHSSYARKAVLLGGMTLADAALEAPVHSGVRYYTASTEGDVLRLLDIAMEYHAESRYSGVPFSREKFLRSFGRTVKGPNTLSLVAEYDGRPVGLMGAKIGEYFLGTGMKVATNYIFYVSPRVRGSFMGGKIAVRLMRIFLDWSRSAGADEVNIHAVSGITPAQTDKFLRNTGFETYGGNYARKLSTR